VFVWAGTTASSKEAGALEAVVFGAALYKHLARELGLVCRLLAPRRFQLQGRQLHFAAHLTKILTVSALVCLLHKGTYCTRPFFLKKKGIFFKKGLFFFRNGCLVARLVDLPQNLVLVLLGDVFADRRL
jgi:hypothetical protein